MKFSYHPMSNRQKSIKLQFIGPIQGASVETFSAITACSLLLTLEKQDISINLHGIVSQNSVPLVRLHSCGVVLVTVHYIHT